MSESPELSNARQNWHDALKQEEEAFAAFMRISSKTQEYEWLRQSRERVAMTRKSLLTAMHKEETKPQE